MKKVTFFMVAILGFLSAVYGQSYSPSPSNNNLANQIIAMEKTALEAWNKGNPDEFLRLYSEEEYTYFDPYLKKRIDSYETIKKLYNDIRGQVSVNKYEMVDPLVQTVGKDMAVLTFNLYSYSGNDVYKWNCTEIFKLQAGKEWKIIHTHWSYIRPMDMQ